MKKETKKWLRQVLWFIQLGLVSLVMISAICFALMIKEADAQNHHNYVGQHNGISYLAEKEIRESETRKAEHIAKAKNAEIGIQFAAPADVDAEANEEDHSDNCRIVVASEGSDC